MPFKEIVTHLKDCDFLICFPLLPYTYVLVVILREIIYVELGWGEHINSAYEKDAQDKLIT